MTQTNQLIPLGFQEVMNKSSNISYSKQVGNIQINLLFSQANLRAGEQVKLTFDFKYATNNQSLTDLQPHLEEKGHLVIVKQPSYLTKTDYLHSHSLTNTAHDKIEFMTSFPEPGKYKLWLQFKRNSKVIVTDFLINVL